MARPKDTKVPLGDSAKATASGSSSPFAGLAGLRAALPDAPAPTAPATTPAPAARFAQKIVVRLEKKGHGGKAVTVVSGVLPKARDEIMAALKRGLGTGAREDGDDIVVQGDVVDRVAAALSALGAANVIVGTKR